MARLPHGQLSQEPRAILRREKKARDDAEWAATNLEPADPVSANGASDQGDPEKIGVFTVTTPPAPIRPEADDEPQTYHCLTCLGVIEFGAPECPTCETRLSWEGINDPADQS